MRLSSNGWAGASLLTIGLGIVAAGPLQSTTAATGERPAAAATDPAETAAGLIPQLGNGTFAVRESTTNQLLTMGIEIKPALVAALDDADPEIRMRARRILTSVVEADFQHRLAVFAVDVNDTKHCDLPGWSKFRKLVGGDREARNLFVEMERAESELLNSFDADPTAAARTLESRIHGQLAFQGRIGANGLSLELGSVAALLFVGSDKSVRLPEECAGQLGNLAYQQSFQQAIASGQQSKLLKKILGTWITRDISPNVSFQNLYLAIQFNLKEGLAPAIRVLQQPGALPQANPIALLTIAKFGDKGQLAVVEPFMAATEICAQIKTDSTTYVTQLRDVALFASLRLANQDPKNFGFARLPSDDQVQYQIANLGFMSNDERDAAFKKWSEWRTENLSPHDSAKALPAKS